MKRLGNAYHKVYAAMGNIELAHMRAQEHKQWYPEVQMVNDNPEYYLSKLHVDLKDKTFTTSEYTYFTIIDKGKERKLAKLPYYPDRIAQWALMLQIEHVFVKNFIYHTYAAIPGKGTHLALCHIREAVRNDPVGTRYCLKLDVKKYFESIDQNILKRKIRTKIKDPDILWLLDDIIDSAPSGVPIGNYTSQYFANFYLSAFDHWLKERKKCRYYYRYMDDIVIFSHNKNKLHRLYREIEEYLWEKLKLKVKENWQVFPTMVRGLDFVGYRVFDGYVLARKRTGLAVKRKMRRLLKKDHYTISDVCCVGSYKGVLKHCDGYSLYNSYVYPVKERMKNEDIKALPQRRRRAVLAVPV